MTGESDPNQPPSTPPAAPPGAYGGYPPPGPYGAYPPPYQPVPTGPRNGLGIAGLVLAIVGLLASWSVIGGIIFGLAAVIVGFLARGRCKRGEADNNGVAIAGIVLGFVAMVLSVVFVVIWITVGVRWFDEVGGGDYVSCMENAGNDRAAQQQCEDTIRQRVEDKYGVTPTPTR